MRSPPESQRTQLQCSGRQNERDERKQKAAPARLLPSMPSQAFRPGTRPVLRSELEKPLFGSPNQSSRTVTVSDYSAYSARLHSRNNSATLVRILPAADVLAWEDTSGVPSAEVDVSGESGDVLASSDLAVV